jgi:excisionase family DNA binding protein
MTPMTIEKQAYYAYLYDELLTVAEVAAELGVDYRKVYELVQDENIYGKINTGDIWLIPRRELDDARRVLQS